ncbi:vWA domain-containing protein [Paractinoplanes toevensis]|uniref:VWA domain containing CoxE-like protein n=1 Tax=Paractinoplanes toevensis TaxID=571911 RepID=A0A919T9M7_9ACTN|nr:VWA domain-containing protein [Actinoplanes toevensis]GIM90101.1 hypothetical protein Ato02nite_018940 [Actinoplanes toevensis]
MAAETGHVQHPATPPDPTATAGSAVADPRWHRWSAAWTKQIAVLTGRTDVTVTVAPGLGHGAPACYIPSQHRVEVDATIIGDPEITDPARPGHKKDVPAPYGALVHEAAHAMHSRWTDPPGTAPILSHIAGMLEESRAELGHRRRRPRDRQWLRACVRTIVDPSSAPTDTAFNAAYAAGLLLARVDTGILKPADVRPLRAAATRVLGKRLLRKLRTLWREAHTVADDDAPAMIDLARRWCIALGIDPDAAPQIPAPGSGTGTGTGTSIAGAITAVLAAVVDLPPLPPGGEPGSGEPDDEDAASPPAPDPATLPPVPKFLGDGPQAEWTSRTPRPAELRAARVLAGALRRAQAREPIMMRHDAALPPGRLRARAAIAGEAQAAAGAVPTALPWQRTIRQQAPAPELKVAVLVDVSGSMRSFVDPLSSAAWILGTAAHKAGARSTTIAVGGRATVVIAPGQRPGTVSKLKADAQAECFDVAVGVAHNLLDLRTAGTARLLVVVSDGLFYRNGYDHAQRTIDWLTATGCKVLWLAPADQSTHTYTRVTTIEVKDPIDAIALIGKAATRALAGK